MFSLSLSIPLLVAKELSTTPAFSQLLNLILHNRTSRMEYARMNIYNAEPIFFFTQLSIPSAYKALHVSGRFWKYAAQR